MIINNIKEIKVIMIVYIIRLSLFIYIIVIFIVNYFMLFIVLKEALQIYRWKHLTPFNYTDLGALAAANLRGGDKLAAAISFKASGRPDSSTLISVRQTRVGFSQHAEMHERSELWWLWKGLTICWGTRPNRA